ncbi:uncharacterized protein LOC130961978 isoform X2 [Arachis stenosperma]|uniref:uncharacterized protein LOC130961978 isoform X2 n=1 Tax=Arachis stenosperma TaxID=217475 RepID=UPI0025AC7AF7|nr:uncharacterized protein LOC130961978 isoform X2 [Arachis stenosperma]
MEENIKRLFQIVQSVSEDNNAKRDRVMEATDLKLEAIQTSITQLLSDHKRDHSFMHESSTGSHSGADNFYRCGSNKSILKEDQISLVAIHMTGMAIPWFQMSQCSAPFRSWNQLKHASGIEFGPSLFKSPRELIFKLQQQGSVSNYYVEFIALANRTHIHPLNALRDCFISVLRPDIKREVKAQCPPLLMKVFQTPAPQSQIRTPPRNTLPPLLPTPNQKLTFPSS